MTLIDPFWIAIPHHSWEGTKIVIHKCDTDCNELSFCMLDEDRDRNWKWLTKTANETNECELFTFRMKSTMDCNVWNYLRAWWWQRQKLEMTDKDSNWNQWAWITPRTDLEPEYEYQSQAEQDWIHENPLWQQWILFYFDHFASRLYVYKLHLLLYIPLHPDLIWKERLGNIPLRPDLIQKEHFETMIDHLTCIVYNWIPHDICATVIVLQRPTRLPFAMTI